MLNQTVLTGNLGEDPKVSFTGEGKPVANFSLAFKSSLNGKKTSWIRVVCFNKLATIVESYLHKGAKIGLIGILDQNKCQIGIQVVRGSAVLGFLII